MGRRKSPVWFKKEEFWKIAVEFIKTNPNLSRVTEIKIWQVNDLLPKPNEKRITRSNLKKLVTITLEALMKPFPGDYGRLKCYVEGKLQDPNISWEDYGTGAFY